MCFLAIIGFIMNEKLDGSELIIKWDLFNSKGISAMFTYHFIIKVIYLSLIIL